MNISSIPLETCIYGVSFVRLKDGRETMINPFDVYPQEDGTFVIEKETP